MKDILSEKPIMVSFQVRPGDWPDLYRWLHSIGRRRERSLRIREVLENAAKKANGSNHIHVEEEPIIGSGGARPDFEFKGSASETDQHSKNEIEHDRTADQEALTNMLHTF